MLNNRNQSNQQIQIVITSSYAKKTVIDFSATVVNSILFTNKQANSS